MKKLPDIGTNLRTFCDGPSGKLEILLNIFDWNSVCIICHPHPLHQGTMDNKVVSTIAKAFENKHITTVRFNFRGVGKSEGSYDNAVGEIEDLKAIYKLVSDKKVNKIYLAGFSFGTYIAAKVSQEFPCEHLLMVGSATSGSYFTGVNNLSVPVTIIHGDIDEVVPIESVVAWQKNLEADKKFIIMEGVGHFFHGKLIELRDLIEKECFHQ